MTFLIDLPNCISNDLPDCISNDLPNCISIDLPNCLSNDLPNCISDDLTDDLSDRASDCLPHQVLQLGSANRVTNLTNLMDEPHARAAQYGAAQHGASSESWWFVSGPAPLPPPYLDDAIVGGGGGGDDGVMWRRGESGGEVSPTSRGVGGGVRDRDHGDSPTGRSAEMIRSSTMAGARWHLGDGTSEMAPRRWHLGDGTSEMALLIAADCG